MPIALGPFDLLEPVGKGGMAVVWKGVHRDQQIPVAVKVLQETPDVPDGHRSFHHEIRAVSALDHPGIVLIFDHGEVPGDAAAASQGRLREGAPYLVMEFASRGTLRSVGRPIGARDRATGSGPVTGRGAGGPGEPTGPTDSAGMPPLAWPTLRAILLTLLDALAHAHARGVLHRDLKPDNVLLCGPDDLRPGIKLSDFGIARPLDDSFELEEKPVGTPQYMAPEQLRNDRDAFGPHTDLYALGHLAWRLATGRLAWHGLQGPSLMYAQLRKSPPPFSPSFPVPEGFETVLRTLLQKEPHARYQRAADAALALAHLPDLPGGDAAFAPLEADTGTLRVVIGGRGPEGGLTPDLRPPLPERFTPDLRKPPVRLLGAGLGLFGLRPVPFVGREPELERAWRELAKVHTEGKARVVVVRGAAGVGKTRFLERIAERAHELGGANVLSAVRTGGGSALDRLAEPLVRFLHAHPLDPADQERRFGDLLKGLELGEVRVADALGLLLDPTELDLPEVQRATLLRRTLELVALDRPLVLCCDDVDDTPDLLKLARQLLATRDRQRSPVLVLASVSEGADDPELLRHLAALDTHEATAAVSLGPFEGGARRGFVRAVAALDPDLERRVADQTGGNPLYAVQCISDWVARDQLVPGPAGYRRRPTERPESDALSEVWDRRIRSVVSGIEGPAMALLERAAVAGVAVDVFEWQAACDDPDGQYAAQNRAMFQPKRARMRNAVVEALFESGLARPTETGFVFTHRDFQRALVQRARDAGRYRAHAGAYGATLEHRTTDATAARCARFHLEAADYEHALPLLLRAESWQRRSLGPAAALVTLQQAESLLRVLRLAPDDRRRVEVWTRRAELLERTGQLAQARKAAARAHQLAAAAPHTDLDARAQMVLGAVDLAEGNPVAAEANWLRAVALLGPTGPVVESVRTWHWLRRLAVERGDVRESAVRGERIRELAQRAVGDAERTPALLALAEHLVDARAPADAAARASEVVALADRRRDHASAAKAWSILAGVAELGGDWAGARDAWMHAVELLDDQADERRAALARCRWAFTECREQRWQAARAAVEPALHVAGRIPEVAAGVRGILALAAAGRGNWGLHDREVATLQVVHAQVPVHQRGFVALCLLGADLCRAAKHPRREKAWVSLAREHLVSAGDTAAANGLAARLEALAGA
jgi:tetratricopeptide (TPR) repeat protein